MPKREYNYYDIFKNKRKYDEEPFKCVEKENFKCIDKELAYNFNYDYCLQDACIYYLKTVYDLYGKLQDEIRFYRSFRNRDFGEILSSMTFGFFQVSHELLILMIQLLMPMKAFVVFIFFQIMNFYLDQMVFAQNLI